MTRRKRKNLPSEPVISKIESLSHDGRGITHIDGKTTFIWGALPGELIKFKYMGRRKSFDTGIATEILESSPDRINPICNHFDICGGCSLQHMSMEKQLAFKQETFLEQLKHFGNVQPETIIPPISSDTHHYRRKARMAVKYVFKKEKVLVGFHEKQSSYIADIEECPIMHESVDKLIPELKQLIQGLNAYQQIPQIEVAVGDDITALILRHLCDLDKDDIQKLQSFAETKRIHLYLQSKGLDTIKLLWPENTPERLSYALAEQDLIMQFHPADFVQVHADINRKIVALTLELLDLNKNDTVLDLFCGLGNFTLAMARHAKQVVGVEMSDEMVERGGENAKLNDIQNVEFFKADLSQDCSTLDWARRDYDRLLLDPPRIGALEIIKQLPKLSIRQIVYVSCNPATLARDAKELVHEQGYRLVKAGILNMFPHTGHVESIAQFIKTE